MLGIGEKYYTIWTDRWIFRFLFFKGQDMKSPEIIYVTEENSNTMQTNCL